MMKENNDENTDNEKPINVSDWEQSSQQSINSLTDEELKSLVHQLVTYIPEAEVLQIISKNQNLSKGDLLSIIEGIIAKKNKKKRQEKKKKDDLDQEGEEEAIVAEGMQKHDIINNRVPGISFLDRLIPGGLLNVLTKLSGVAQKGDHLDKTMKNIAEKKHDAATAHKGIIATAVDKIGSSLSSVSEEEHHDPYAHNSRSRHAPVTPVMSKESNASVKVKF
jgi:hypothetical protein